MKQKITTYLKKNIQNIPGWRTGRKIVVFESDDWGAIRLPSASVLKDLKKMGIRVGDDHYIRNDALASEEDLTLLFNTLNSHHDSREMPVKFTANTIMANPDFKRIRDDRFKTYHYELFTDTLKSYPEHAGSFELWEKGIAEGIFRPQFHGREHLHVHRWLNGLKEQGSETSRIFNHNMYAVCSSSTSEIRKSYMAAWEWENESDYSFILHAINEGLRLFEKQFGYPSRSIIAPNYTWDREMEKEFNRNGVKFIQGSTVQRVPGTSDNEKGITRHYTGQKNTDEQIYLVRNCKFEPSADPQKDWVGICLKDMETAFRWKKPAIIETHRVNYIGYINSCNRDKSLELINELLRKMMQKWPEIEFMTSDELGRLIEEDTSRSKQKMNE